MSDPSKDLNDPELQAILEELLGSYAPLLEEELARARNPEQLAREAEQEPSCEEEVKLAERLFERFASEEVSERLLRAVAVDQPDLIRRQPWCLRHLFCCYRFGWLLYRARTFRAGVYYLKRYWLCVRRVLGNDPTGRPFTAAEREDLFTLVQAFGEVYKPFLSRQLASAGVAAELTGEVIDGKVDCTEGVDESQAILDRLFTTELAPALYGREAWIEHQKNPGFWNCRCWCLCAIRFGWCLARAHSLVAVYRCYRDYLRCLRRCFGALFCALTDPQGCVPEEVRVDLTALVVPITGSAGGGGFSHYILEWSRDHLSWHTTDFFYPPIPPGSATQGNSPVTAGLLAYLNTTALDEGPYFLRLTVFGTGVSPRVCEGQFSLFKQDVRILGIDGYTNLDTQAYDPNARFVETVPALCSRPSGVFEVSFGECISILGSAVVGGCEDRKIKRYTIDYKPGFETDPTSGGWVSPPFWSIEYDTVWQYREMNKRRDTSVLTSVWVSDCVVNIPFPPWCLDEEPNARLSPSCWTTHTSTCQLSGLITLRLTVTDTDGNLYYDTQRVWIDNKPVCAMIRIDAVLPCADLFVSQFATPPDCSVPWNVPLSGIAYDELIDPGMPATRPNDNFDSYWITVAKQGGSEVQIPISTGPTCFFGTSRVGNPGTACTPCNPAHPDPAALFGTLAQFDLRAIDPLCHDQVPYGVPDDLLLDRGECCVYIFTLHVRDRTIFSGGPHAREAVWPVKICNDLKK